MMNETAMDTSTVRSSPVSDGQQSRLNAVKTQAEVDGPIKRRHEEKQHTPSVGTRQRERELVQHDEKRQPYPGNDGKVRNLDHFTFEPLAL